MQEYTTFQCTYYHYTINHSLNCLSYVIYMLQISAYQNIAQLLACLHINFLGFGNKKK